jgi:hypothetical protein
MFPSGHNEIGIRDLLLPATDGGVVVQLLVVLLIWAAAVFAMRHQAEWRMVAIGGGLIAVALIGVRALH